MIQSASIMINIKLSLFIIITAYTKIKITNIIYTFRLKKVYLNTYYFVLFSINRKESIMVCPRGNISSENLVLDLNIIYFPDSSSPNV